VNFEDEEAYWHFHPTTRATQDSHASSKNQAPKNNPACRLRRRESEI